MRQRSAFVQCPTSTASLDVRGVEDGEHVGDQLAVTVGGRVGAPPGAPVAERVGGQDPVVARQERHLRLPDPGVGDRPGAGQEDRGFPVADDLVGQPPPFPLDDSGHVRLDRAHAHSVGRGHCKDIAVAASLPRAGTFC
jgi:hypothetical protein